MKFRKYCNIWTQSTFFGALKAKTKKYLYVPKHLDMFVARSTKIYFFFQNSDNLSGFYNPEEKNYSIFVLFENPYFPIWVS